MTTVDGVLNGTTWQGPARDRFVEDWNVSFKQALGSLNEAFGVAGTDCIAIRCAMNSAHGFDGPVAYVEFTSAVRRGDPAP